MALVYLYFGLGRAVWSRHPTRLLFASHPVGGGAVMLAAAALLAWALLVFRSRRLLARIEQGHQLCTTGPFRATAARRRVRRRVPRVSAPGRAHGPGPVLTRLSASW